jgi:hypothetical protein
MEVKYELDPWEWQGASHSIDVDPEDYEGMSADEIKRAVYAAIREDAESKLHLVYAEDDVANEILSALAAQTS